ncbi:fluoride efflux transporter FluC [Nodularia spumigena]|uniref:fluoride efflux transporter FluC n=1 Tax=Nodularia spumigena TaxID=70799 RepID=UPI002B21BB51|nr:CrcB family protein [Nodularia spumigena]MEA5557583.1 CrcB family protein [Nodularia spumigena CH309]
MWAQAAAVAIGGAAGSLARWGVSVLLMGRGGGGGDEVGAGLSPFPSATLLVNVVGCVAIGAAMQVITSRPAGAIDPVLRAGLIAGLLGGLTTFSAFGYEGFTFLREGRVWMALGVLGLQVGAGVCGVAVGWYGARAIGA